MANNPKGSIPGVQFLDITQMDIQDPQLSVLNQLFRQIVSCLNILAGSQGVLFFNVAVEAAGQLLTAKAPSTGQGQLALGNATASAATAGSDTLPANPAGFLVASLNGQTIKIPYYKA